MHACGAECSNVYCIALTVQTNEWMETVLILFVSLQVQLYMYVHWQIFISDFNVISGWLRELLTEPGGGELNWQHELVGPHPFPSSLGILRENFLNESLAEVPFHKSIACVHLFAHSELKCL